MKLRIGDEILVTAGKDKGKHGKIARVYPVAERVLVPEINVYKKHKKGIGDQKGGVFELSRPLSTAKVALICPSCKKPTRVGFRILENGEKNRICAKCKRQIDTNKETKMVKASKTKK